ncbi:MAG: methyl-accepting chemotaxis protein [Candidatus Heimdallarchaeota archaeon]|nr:methyl-accepting chemotaxis protein [Candidatus Heimdallarchaeota archaeon]
MSDNELRKNSKGKGTRLSFVLGRGFGVIILITLITGVVSVVGLMNTADEYQGLIDGAIELDEDSMKMSINLLQARRVEKDFIATGELNLLVEHDLYVELAEEIADEIAEEDVTSVTTGIATDAKVAIGVYDTESHAVFDKLIERGGGAFGSESGTVGTLQATISEIDDMIQFDYEANLIGSTEYLELHSRYLDIRKDEKDYLLERESGGNYLQYITHLYDDIPEFLTIIDSLNLESVRETEYHDDFGNYLTAVATLVTTDDEIDSLTVVFIAAASSIEEYSAALSTEAVKILEESIAKVEENVTRILLITMMLIIMAIIIGISLTIWITRGIVKPIYEIESEVETIGNGDLTGKFEFSKQPSSELTTLGDNVEKMKFSLLSIIGSISSSNEILTTSSEDLFSGAEEINASSEEVATTSQAMSNGATSQTEMITDVNDRIQKTSNMVEEIIKKIQDNTQDVSQIALQTNILALNAGIEASRAGDYGRGFMVVAENVRKLSDQSKNAADQIAIVADEIAENLQASFTTISNSMGNIVSVSEETAASAEEVAAAVEEMTATVEELSSSASQLTTLAEDSSGLIGQFTLNKSK